MVRGKRRFIFAGVIAANLCLIAPAWADVATWPDGIVTRLEALALVQTLNAAILASPSATLALEKWCAEHKLAGSGEAKISARLIRGTPKPATEEQRQRLQVGPDEKLGYRHVELVCGDRVLSEADNWYVPSRLTPEMNRLLDTTDTPYGKAVQSLKPYRQTFAAKVLWWPLPQGWETQTLPAIESGGTLTIPETLFEHRAIVFNRDRLPLAEVHESYKRPLLDFLPPQR
jgi:chorismate-pyruvate lyase